MTKPNPFDDAWNPGLMSHAEWKRGRTLLFQRERRARYARIDYYPSDRALDVIRATDRVIRQGLSTAIDALILAAYEPPEP